jgi:hypothetical protein
LRREHPGNHLDLEMTVGRWGAVARHRAIHRGPGGWQPLPSDSDKPPESGDGGTFGPSKRDELPIDPG